MFFFSFFHSCRQATGIVFILVCQVLEVPKPSKHFPKSKCRGESHDGKVPDLQNAMYFMTSVAVAMAFLFICTFKPSYKRLDMERRRAALRILNASTQQRLPCIPNSESVSENGLNSPD